MSHADTVLQHIDWKLLREQKEFCWNESNNRPDTAHLYDGILHLMDSLQDAAFIDRVATEAELFGEYFA